MASRKSILAVLEREPGLVKPFMANPEDKDELAFTAQDLAMVIEQHSESNCHIVVGLSIIGYDASDELYEKVKSLVLKLHLLGGLP